MDFNKVKLKAYTQAPDGTSPEDLIAEMARVSMPPEKAKGKPAAGLIQYLKDHNHWSPFEMINVVLEIETPRDISRQLLRHRSFAFQEFSQRYASVTEDVGFVEGREVRMQDLKNRQNSLEEVPLAVRGLWETDVWVLKRTSKEAYEYYLKQGVAKEVARVLLPEGLTVSRLYMNGTLRSWMHYCKIRMGPETQKEHRDLATKCFNVITEEVFKI